VATIKAFSEGKVRVTRDREIVDVEGRPIGGYDLTDEINGLLKKEP
jgi:hypothetical protein